MIITDFKARLPIVATDKLPPNVATVATNCDMQTGQICPVKGPTLIQPIARPGDIRSIRKIGDTWVGFTEDVSFAKAPSDNDRTYYLGDGYAKHTDADLVDAGGIPANYPSTAYRMGVTPPAAAPSLSVSGAQGEIIGECTYCYTIVNVISATYEEESAPSPPTAPRTVYEGEAITVQGMVAPTDGGYDTTYFRVYRSMAGGDFVCVPNGRDGNGDFLYDTVTSTTTLTDNDSSTGNIYINLTITLATIGWDRLPDTATCLTEFQNGMFAAIDGQHVLLPVLWTPYAFPQGNNSAAMDYRYELPYTPNQCASFNDILVIGTNANPYALMGSDPSDMQLVKIPYEYACAGDMCSTEIGVFYPSPDGLVLCDGLKAEPWTKDVFTKAQWEALGPSNLKMFYHDDKLVGFFKGSTTGFFCDFKKSKEIVDFTLGLTFWDGQLIAEDDTLYLLLQNGSVYYIYSWATGPNLTATYSGRFRDGYGPVYRAARIEGDFSGGATVDFSLTIDGATYAVSDVDSDDAFFIPVTGDGWGSEYTYSLSTGDAKITALRLGGNLGELHE